jgi:alpha-D-ribose 1-methylphosphonate 5-triphosphate diphosphatase
MKVITNGNIITPTQIISGMDLVLENERIKAIVLTNEANHPKEAEIIDADGGWITPGFIDIHSDYIEHMAAPRPTALMDFKISLREAEKELLSHGITTMFHSLSLYKETEFPDKPIRQAENIVKFIELIEESHHSRHLIRHRFHARYEIDNLDRVEELKDYICEKKVHLLSFMDHTPGQGQYRDLEMFKQTVKGYRKVSDQEVVAIIERSQNRPKMTIEAIRELVQLARDHGIAVASHDDDTVDKVQLVHEFGATISEFPITIETARYATGLGMHTVAGAPNVLLGGSHSGNLGAADAIVDGSVDILCSDYYPAALLHAVFRLHEEHGLELPFLFSLLTINPAKAVEMDKDLGSVEEGKMGDLLIIKKQADGFPALTHVFVNGELVQATHYRN